MTALRSVLLSSVFVVWVAPMAVADALLSDFDYSHPVQHYAFRSQQQSLSMAYMDVRPSQATGKTVVLLHGKNSAQPPGKASSLRSAMRATAWWSPIRSVSQIDEAGGLPVGFHQLAANTHALLTSIGVERPIILGHSMGGMLAIATLSCMGATWVDLWS